jgi:hypothetical protein
VQQNNMRVRSRLLTLHRCFAQLAELIEDEEELAEIDPSNIVYTGRRRNAPLDYTSEEALKQAGLDSGAGAAEPDEEDAEFKVSLSGSDAAFTPTTLLTASLPFVQQQSEEMTDE